MPGDIQNRQTVTSQTGERPFSLEPVPLLHVDKPDTLPCSGFFRHSGELFLIGFPFFEIDGTHRLRGSLFQNIGVGSFFKVAQLVAQLSHAERTIYRGRFHSDFTHKDDGPGTFFLETQTDSRQLLMQFGPRFRVFDDAVAAFLRDALDGFLAGGMFKIQRGLLRFYLAVRPSSRQFAIFQYRVHRVFFTGPSLFVFNERHDFMRFPDIKTSVRLHNFSAIRVHAIDRNMEMIIVRIIVQAIDSLVSGQAHPFKKNIHQFLHLFSGGLFTFLPGKHPVLYRHIAVRGLPRKGNHFHLLTGMGS